MPCLPYVARTLGVISALATLIFAPTLSWAWGYPVLPYEPGSYNNRGFYTDGNHLGEDELQPEGVAVKAIGPGWIRLYRNDGGCPAGSSGSSCQGYGELYAVVDHDLGGTHTFTNADGAQRSTSKIFSIYGHLRKSAVRGGTEIGLNVGSWVEEGTVIGYVNDNAHNGDGAEHVHIGIRLTDWDTASSSLDPAGPARGYRDPPGGIPACDNDCQTTFAAFSQVIQVLNGGTERRVVGDWNGDGIDTVWTFSRGQWTIPASDNGGTPLQFTMGLPDDLPMVGDWNNDGRDDAGTFRASQSPSTFYLDINHDAGADWIIGLSGSFPQDIPVAGDWDGDGDSDVGAWDSTTRIFWLFRITGPSTLVDHASFQMGNPGDIPIAGNWDGAGPTEVGIFRRGEPNANTNNFHFRKSDGTVVSLTAMPGGMPSGWGDTGDVPVIGDWNNDNYDTIGLYRPSNQGTYLNNDLPKFSGVSPPPPTVATGGASSIGQTTATLNGTVNPNGASTSTAFEYGTTTGYGSTVTAQTLTGSTSQAISASPSGLACATTYHFRARGTNSGGTRYGLDRSFATTACTGAPPPTPSNFRVTGTTATSASLGWNDVPGESGYRIYKWNGSAWFLHAQLGPNATTYTDGGLTCEGQYFYDVSSYNASGESGPAAFVQADTQPCGPQTCTSFSINPSAASPTYQAGSQSVTITGAPAGCTGGNWTASGNGSWITTSPTSGSGSGSATVSWSQNTPTSPRAGNAMIAGRTFAVSQPWACSGRFICEDFEATASGWMFQGSATQRLAEGVAELTPSVVTQVGSTFFNTPAPINAFTAIFQMRLDSAGGTVADGFTFAVVEGGPVLGISGSCLGYCGTPGRSFAIEFDTYVSPEYNDPAPPHVGLDVDGDLGSVVTASLSPIVDQGLITVRIVFSNGTVNVYIQGGTSYPSETLVLTGSIPNWTPFTGYFGFTGATGGFVETHVIDNVSVSLAPPSCTSFSINPTSSSPSYFSGSQLVTVTGSPSGCTGGSWTASGNGSWITVSPISGSGPSGSTTVSWSQNTSSSSRSGSATIAGNSHTVTQGASPVCTTFSINPTSVNVGYQAGSSLVFITGVPAGCQGGSWTAFGNGSWITVTPAGGSGSGSVTVWWTQNPSTSPDSGTATIAANSFTVNQAGFQVSQVGPVALGVDVVASSQSDGNRVFEPGEAVTIAPSWRNLLSAPVSALVGTATAFTGPAGPSYSIGDDAAYYGNLPGGGTASCTSTTDCYALSVSIPAARPALHWDAALSETLSTGSTKEWTIHIGGSFGDVPRSSPFYRFVETLLHHSISGGCTTSQYCPTVQVTRDQMSVFVVVAKEGAGYAPPDCTTPLFSDVPPGSPFCRYIEELARRGVAGGCGGGKYCPGNRVTRDQMAIFVLRTLDPSLSPASCTTPMFADVPTANPFCPWIEELARRGIVSGCGGGNYCPSAGVTREQMGVFISSTFGLQLYGP